MGRRGGGGEEGLSTQKRRRKKKWKKKRKIARDRRTSVAENPRRQACRARRWPGRVKEGLMSGTMKGNIFNKIYWRLFFRRLTRQVIIPSFYARSHAHGFIPVDTHIHTQYMYVNIFSPIVTRIHTYTKKNSCKYAHLWKYKFIDRHSNRKLCISTSISQLCIAICSYALPNE